MPDASDILDPVPATIWDAKYRLKAPDGTPRERAITDTWRRIARAAAKPEPVELRRQWAGRFQEALTDFAFLPAGRILAGAGTRRRVTLANCFVMGTIGDDMASIFQNLKEAALTLQTGGGIGHDFSTLRPVGAEVRGVGADASGPLSFMDVWDSMCRTILSAGGRRGAMMATLSADHPDIEAFIAAKAEPGRLRNFNLSVLVSDAFVEAVRADADWPLNFAGKCWKTLKARNLWHQIMRATHAYAEPGVIFIDRVNRANNLGYCEQIRATNPCGEQPLPDYGACFLGSINLARLVQNAFEPEAGLDETRLAELTACAVRFLDDVIDISRFALAAQKREAREKRRIGLGVTGLADALIMCRKHYASSEAVALASRWMALIERSAYLASAELAAEKGAFPAFEAEAYLAAPGIAALDEDVRAAIAKNGVRNGLLTSVAPTGTISLLAGNVSSGVEPVFDFSYRRHIRQRDGTTRELMVEDFAYCLFRQKFGLDAPLPDYFVTADALTPHEHLAMQAALQRHVDSAISKTINCPPDITFEDFERIYLDAYDMGLKGCTTFRPNPVTGEVLVRAAGDAATAPTTPPADPITPAKTEPDPVPAVHDGEIVYMTEPLERDHELSGYTYKLRWPDTTEAFYITINDMVRDGRRRPFEIFINTKNLEHYAWIVALTRMISAVFRRGGDVSFVVEELKAIFDPRGGQWLDGRYVASLIAAIGEIVERHMIRTGFISGPVSEAPDRTATTSARPPRLAGALYCPRCQSATLIHQEGCIHCRTCGYSKCA